MLKRFFLNVLSSFVGAWLAIVLVIIGLSILLIGIIGSFSINESERVSGHSILRIALSGPIDEAETEKQFNYTILLNGRIEQTQNLKTLVAAIEKAKGNSNIDALFIECMGSTAAPATLNALRNCINDFKKSGKRVFAYGDNLSMGDYYVATCADVIYLNPAGNLDLQGLSGTSLYFKDLLDKIGIEIQTVRVGSFKSAIEPYTSNEMSDAARLQLDSLYGEMWSFILDGISKERKIKPTVLDSLVNRFIFLDKATVAENYNLVDACLYFREVRKKIAEYVGKDADDLNFISPETLIGETSYNSALKKQIAVLYAVGEIAEYEGAGINCSELVPIIVKLAEDDNVKGLVLRVNSPGGSVFGSEQIGEALDYFKSTGKPFAVSMGDYAASGGYWISAGADKIFADPLTITGSIGIFGMVPNVGKLCDKLGVHPQTVSTNPGVLFPSIFYSMSEEQKDALQKSVDRGYEQFVERVAKGRHKSVDYIKSIAEGRVWSAIKAKQLGLVDSLGSLGEAISWAAEKAEINDPNIVAYPAPETSLWNMIASNNAYASQIETLINRMSTVSLDEKMIDFAKWVLLQNHVQARSPFYSISF